jgi:hypothetical protein
MPLPHVIWRCLENKPLPCQLRIRARCRQCGCQHEVMPIITPKAERPSTWPCTWCGHPELTIMSAMALKSAPE